MGANSAIEWTTHTFNPWTGCEKASPACAHCYAEAWAKRAGRDFTARIRTSRDTWRQPLKWHKAAAAAGTTAAVLCASLADVFESHPGIVPGWRSDLWNLIRATPALTYVLLTKRPDNIETMFPFGSDEPRNVVFGITAENQLWYRRRWRHLRRHRAAGWRTFLSAEPLLGPLTLDAGDHPDGVVSGGETGPKARVTDPDWVRGLRDQCATMGIPFMHKHWGEWAPAANWPSEAREGYDARGLAFGASIRVGRAHAGRSLDGREHMASPFATAYV